MISPVNWYGSHRIYWWKHSHDGEEVLKSAITQAEVPVVVKRIDKVEEGVKRRHWGVWKGQVDDKVVGYGSHASVSEDDPDNCDVPSDGHQDDERVGDGPQSHLRGKGEQSVCFELMRSPNSVTPKIRVRRD